MRRCSAVLAAVFALVGTPSAAAACPTASLPITASKALKVAKRNFGWARGSRPAAYLVHITDHPSAFDRPSGAEGWIDIHPLQVGDLAWLVVIRHAQIPILGGHGGSYRATLVVIEETTRPRYVIGLTI